MKHLTPFQKSAAAFIAILLLVAAAAIPVGPEYDTLTDLLIHQPVSTVPFKWYTLKGRNNVGDGGGGDFYWKAGDTTVTNSGTVFAWGTGRLLRIFSGPVIPNWFGAYTNATDNTLAIQQTLDYATSSPGNGVQFLPGRFAINSTLTMAAATQIKGSGVPTKSDTGAYQGSWLDYTGTTLGQYMLVITNGAANGSLVQKIGVQDLGFVGHSLAKGILSAPGVHPKAMHGFRFENLNMYQNKVALTFGEAGSDINNQVDFDRVISVTADEFVDAFVEVTSRNFTCVSIENCNTTAASTTSGTHYIFHGGNIISVKNSAGGRGDIFILAEALSGELHFEGDQWEASTAAVQRFFKNTSPGFGNSAPFTFVNCVVGAPIELAQNERVVTMTGNTMFDSVLFNAQSLSVYDNGNDWASQDYPLVNPGFTSDLSGWTQSHWHWVTGASSDGAAAHDAGFTNAISQDLTVKAQWLYSVIFTIQSKTAGTITPYLGNQAGSTYGANGIFSQSFTNAQGNGTIPITFLPSSDFDGTIKVSKMTFSPAHVIDSVNIANFYIPTDLLRVTAQELTFGGDNGLLSHSPLMTYDQGKRWLKLGDFGHVPKMSMGSSVEQPATFYLGAPNSSLVVHNPAGGSFVELMSGGPYSVIGTRTNMDLFFATQDETFSGTNIMGTFVNLFRHTRVSQEGNWVFGWPAFGSNNRVEVNGGLLADTEQVISTLSANNVTVTNLLTTQSMTVNGNGSVIGNLDVGGSFTAASMQVGQFFTGYLLTTNGVVYKSGAAGPTGASIAAGNAAIWASNSIPATLFIRTTTDGSAVVDTPIGSGGGGSDVPGNPSALVGLTTVNGSGSGTYMRANGAPALDQSIAPAWTGNHIFAGSSPITITNSAVTGIPLLINAKAGSTNFLISINNGGTNVFTIGPDGSVTFSQLNLTSLLVSNTITAIQAIRTYRGVIAQASPTTLDFDGATTYNKCTASGNITLATSNLQTNRNYTLFLLNGTASLITISYPQAGGTNAWRFIGGSAPTLSAGQGVKIFLEPEGTTDSTVYATVTPETQL